jgi:hypothetical protein
MNWQGNMSLDQLELIERTFAHLTPTGWIIPTWVHSLRAKIIAYQSQKGGKSS